MGKSTLVNWLVGADVAATGAVRAEDAKGRHTTTTRTLVPLPGGGLLLDTPGMRGFGVDEDAAVDTVYADVAEFAARCRWSDCTHTDEPGCAVSAAIEAGGLDPARLDAWRRLEREAAHAARLADANLARAEKLGTSHMNASRPGLDSHRAAQAPIPAIPLILGRSRTASQRLPGVAGKPDEAAGRTRHPPPRSSLRRSGSRGRRWSSFLGYAPPPGGQADV